MCTADSDSDDMCSGIHGWGRSTRAWILPQDGWRGISFHTSQPIMSGNTVAFNCTILKLWLSSSLGQWCRCDNWPEHYFSKPNSKCPGEVFQIYATWLADVTSQLGQSSSLLRSGKEMVSMLAGPLRQVFLSREPHTWTWIRWSSQVETMQWWSIHHLAKPTVNIRVNRLWTKMAVVT